MLSKIAIAALLGGLLGAAFAMAELSSRDSSRSQMYDPAATIVRVQAASGQLRSPETNP
jgi:hypothetical protein